MVPVTPDPSGKIDQPWRGVPFGKRMTSTTFHNRLQVVEWVSDPASRTPLHRKPHKVIQQAPIWFQ
jgi:hypothetical protein